MRLPLLILLVLPGLAMAQDSDGTDDNRKVKYAERTEIDFVGVEITSEMVRPPVVLIPEVERHGFEPMTELRTDFTREMRDSILQVR